MLSVVIILFLLFKFLWYVVRKNFLAAISTVTYTINMLKLELQLQVIGCVVTVTGVEML